MQKTLGLASLFIGLFLNHLTLQAEHYDHDTLTLKREERGPREIMQYTERLHEVIETMVAEFVRAGDDRDKLWELLRDYIGGDESDSVLLYAARYINAQVPSILSKPKLNAKNPLTNISRMQQYQFSLATSHLRMLYYGISNLACIIFLQSLSNKSDQTPAPKNINATIHRLSVQKPCRPILPLIDRLIGKNAQTNPTGVFSADPASDSDHQNISELNLLLHPSWESAREIFQEMSVLLGLIKNALNTLGCEEAMQPQNA